MTLIFDDGIWRHSMSHYDVKWSQIPNFGLKGLGNVQRWRCVNAHMFSFDFTFIVPLTLKKKPGPLGNGNSSKTIKLVNSKSSLLKAIFLRRYWHFNQARLRTSQLKLNSDWLYCTRHIALHCKSIYISYGSVSLLVCLHTHPAAFTNLSEKIINDGIEKRHSVKTDLDIVRTWLGY